MNTLTLNSRCELSFNGFSFEYFKNCTNQQFISWIHLGSFVKHYNRQIYWHYEVKLCELSYNIFGTWNGRYETILMSMQFASFFSSGRIMVFTYFHIVYLIRAIYSCVVPSICAKIQMNNKNNNKKHIPLILFIIWLKWMKRGAANKQTSHHQLKHKK